MGSRKCKHGMMPWECYYCDEIKHKEAEKAVRNTILDEAVEAVKSLRLQSDTGMVRNGEGMRRDAIEAINNLRGKNE